MAPNSIARYANNSPITDIQELPVPFAERTPTDVFCTVCTGLAALAMLIVAIVSLNLYNLQKMTYPADSQGRHCTLDNPNFNYLYFVDPQDITRRICVQECPKGNEQALKCWPTDSIGCKANSHPGFEVSIYPSSSSETVTGLFCLPEDPQMRENILRDSNLDTRFMFVKAFRSIWISAAVGIGVGCLFLIGVCISPLLSLYVCIILGGISFFFISTSIFLRSADMGSYAALTIVIGILFIILGLIILSTICLSRSEMLLLVSYLRQAVEVIKEQPTILLLIPVFLLLELGLVALCGFQLLAFWSKSQMVFHPEQVYYSPEGLFPQIMQILNLLQFIWGLCFLKSAFSFLVSACGVTKYFWGQSMITFGIKGLFGYHWGSVVGGSFMINFFFIFDLIFDIIKPDEERSPGAYRTFSSICCLCQGVSGLVRDESMAFINMVGLPYCNSCRVSEKIYFMNDDPIDASSSQSVSRYFRLGAHSLVATIAASVCYFMMASQGKIYLPVFLLSYILNISISTYFICIPADLSESLLLGELVKMHLSQVNQKPALPSDDYNGSRAKPNRGYDESQVNEGYDILPTRPY